MVMNELKKILNKIILKKNSSGFINIYKKELNSGNDEFIRHTGRCYYFDTLLDEIKVLKISDKEFCLHTLYIENLPETNKKYFRWTILFMINLLFNHMTDEMDGDKKKKMRNFAIFDIYLSIAHFVKIKHFVKKKIVDITSGRKNQTKEVLKKKVNLLKDLLKDKEINIRDLKQILSYSNLLEKAYFNKKNTRWVFWPSLQ